MGSRGTYRCQELVHLKLEAGTKSPCDPAQKSRVQFADGFPERLNYQPVGIHLTPQEDIDGLEPG
jgi:hypothetical protein